jgi:glycosyltransferase involved in cell wall biosynthesis
MANMGHMLTLACFQSDARDVSPLRKWCELHTVPFRGRNTLSKILQGVIERFPINYVKYRDPGLLATVFQLLGSGNFDVVVVDYSALGWFALRIRERFPAIPIVTRLHNLDTLIWERWTNSQSNGFKRALGKTQTEFVRRFETELASVSDLCLMVGARDAELLRKMAPAANVEFLPAGIDTDHYSFQPQLGAKDLLFMASSYKWHANSDSVTWLHDEIMPRIWRRHPETVLYITGSDYTADMRKWTADGRVVLTGFVPDERVIAAKCRVLVVPMRLGAGIKLKVLTALAMGTAVVTTSQGAEGVAGLDDGTHCLIRDSVEGFADAAGEVLSDDALRQSLAENGRRLVCDRHDWGVISRKFESLLESVVSRCRNTEPASVPLLTQ